MIARSSASRKRRGGGLPGCGSGVTVPTSTKPKPRPRSRVGHLAVLVEAGGHAERIGEVEAEEPLASRGSGAGGARHHARWPAPGSPGGARVSGSRPNRKRPGERPAAGSRQASGKTWRPSGTERQRLDPEHGGEVERRVEMREEVAAARRLVAERRRRAAPRRSRRGGGRPARRNAARAVSVDLRAGREMDVAVGEIDRQRR